MSRSRKKTKIHRVTKAKSEKVDKRDANRKFRRVVKQKKVNTNEEVLPEVRELSNI